jgi:hypothetical protein
VAGELGDRVKPGYEIMSGCWVKLGCVHRGRVSCVMLVPGLACARLLRGNSL